MKTINMTIMIDYTKVNKFASICWKQTENFRRMMWDELRVHLSAQYPNANIKIMCNNKKNTSIQVDLLEGYDYFESALEIIDFIKQELAPAY